MNIFNQILELDDDDNREFSRSMVKDYYSQVDSTLIKMDKALYAFHWLYTHQLIPFAN